VQHLGLRQRVRHSRAGEVEITGLPYRLRQNPAAIRRPPPALGEHTKEVLAEIGYSAAEIEAMQAEGVV
jgi:crotonobetainyl-CoA:carnitine CoA-transferase CaiB-like acyl-CoA transferase